MSSISASLFSGRNSETAQAHCLVVKHYRPESLIITVCDATEDDRRQPAIAYFSSARTRTLFLQTERLPAAARRYRVNHVGAQCARPGMDLCRTPQYRVAGTTACPCHRQRVAL